MLNYLQQNNFYRRWHEVYVGVDIGGTKTLLVVFLDTGEQKQSVKFATPSDYSEFLTALANAYQSFHLSATPAQTIVAVPGKLDKTTGQALGYGTLKWPAAPVQHDFQQALGVPVIIENDAKLAGLSEALLIKNEFKKVLYITISTGIGTAIIVDGVIDPEFSTNEGGQILVQDNGQLKQWEDVASGRAITHHYGKRASEINDPLIWQEIAAKLAIGFIDLIAIIQPEVIIIGGGVGTHFQKFEQPLLTELKKLETPLTPVPPIRQAQRPEEAVIYGCYELARHNHENAA